MDPEHPARRSFIGLGAGALAAAASGSGSPRVAPRQLDASFGSATEAIAGLRARTLSSRELTAHVLRRIARHNPKLNAFVTLDEEGALAAARRSDEARAGGKTPGALEGLPVLVKDSFATAGLRTTSGAKRYEHYVPSEDAAAVARLRAAGAVIVGKTNLPPLTRDYQTTSEIVGTTNNPWDLARTPGGSTGGGAAALAAGLGFLELGSDLGGSIRIPSHFCGVYGHKPTLGLVPLRGHIPPAPDVQTPSDLNVAGPMARAAEDLRLALEVLGGPLEDGIAYAWRLPPPRQSRLEAYRLGFVIDDPFCPLDASEASVLNGALESLRKAGAQLVEGWPAGFDPRAASENYAFLLSAAGRAELRHRDWLAQNEARARARLAWREWFAGFDAFLMPVSFLAAYLHTPQSESLAGAPALPTSGGPRPYMDQLKWCSIASQCGFPATVAPVGRTREGLPVGLQIMGPWLEDATPIDIASRLAAILGGFVAPQGFED